MALSDAYKARIRRYLGFPDINRQIDLRLEGAMNAVHVEGEALAVEILLQIIDLEDRIKSAYPRQKVIDLEDGVRLAMVEEIRSYKEDARRLVADLGVLFDIVPRRTPFSGVSRPNVLGGYG